MIKKVLLLIFAPLILMCGEKTEPKEMVFVCTHGAARSPIAAAYFNKMAEEQDLNYRAIFKATAPDSVLTNETVYGLRNDDFKINGWKPELVSKNDIDNTFKIITFDCELPLNVDSKKIEQWNGTPPISKDYEKARNVIKEKVNQLVETLPDLP